MPPKTPRPPGVDEWVAARIRYEREQRGWSTSELARRVSLAGVRLRQQQVWQTESGKPPRRLSVGEAAAFAKVFGISLAELMTPPVSEDTRDVMGIIKIGREFAEWRRDAGALFGRLLDIAKQIDELDENQQYTADVVVKYSGLGEASKQAVEQLSEIESMIANIRTAISEHGNPWTVIVSMQDQVADLISEDDSGASDGSR